MRPNDSSSLGEIYQEWLDIAHYDSFSRDTTNCVFFFGHDHVFYYIRYKMNEDGLLQGVKGTERRGWLLTGDNPVFVAYYDTIWNCYKDPLMTWDEQIQDMERYGPLFNSRIDTLGYIPQSQLDANRPLLEKAFEEGRYSEMEKIMWTGYTIYTCTGEEYRELVRLGLN